jgi:hypothetical protein
VVLTDGQEDLLRQVSAAAKRYKVDVVVVQDFVHVLEYLWKAAAGWPRVIAHPRLPQIRTCPIRASGSSA